MRAAVLAFGRLLQSRLTLAQARRCRSRRRSASAAQELCAWCRDAVGRMVALLLYAEAVRGSTWRARSGRASRSGALDLAIACCDRPSEDVLGYLGTLLDGKVTSVDRMVPSTPTGLTLIDQARGPLGRRTAEPRPFGIPSPVTTSTSTAGSSPRPRRPRERRRTSASARGASSPWTPSTWPGRSGKAAVAGSTSPCILSLHPAPLAALQPDGRQPSTCPQWRCSWLLRRTATKTTATTLYRTTFLVGYDAIRRLHGHRLNQGGALRFLGGRVCAPVFRPPRARPFRQHWRPPRRPAWSPAFSWSDGAGATAGDGSGKGDAGVTSGRAGRRPGATAARCPGWARNSWVTITRTPSARPLGRHDA